MSKVVPPQVQQNIMLAFRLRDQNRIAESRQLAEKILASFPLEKHTLYLLGSIHLETGEFEPAMSYFKKGVNADKGGHLNQGGIGMLYVKTGDFRNALKWLKIAHKRAPGEVSHLNNLALTYKSLGKIGEAEDMLRRVLALVPNYPQAALNLADILHKKNQFTEAQRLLENALETHENDHELHLSYAYQKMLKGDFQLAEEHYEKALALESHSSEALIGYAEFLIQNGELGRAQALVDTLYKQEPDNLFAVSTLLKLKKIEEVLGQSQEQILNRCHDVIAKSLKEEQTDTMWFFYAAEIEEKLGNYDIAFECLQKANSANRKSLKELGHNYNRAKLDSYVKGLRAYDRWPEILSTPSPEDDRRPVFVIGMPRSGTTLTEQIIAAHPQASGAGERTELWSVLDELHPLEVGLSPSADWMEIFRNSDHDFRKQLSARYLCEYDQKHAGSDRVVDKLPYNFIYAGFAAALFPNAKFVFCRRNRAATGLSIFKQRFVAPYLFDTDLEDISHLYDIHDSLMDFWQTLLPERLHVMDYESLTADPETHARAMIGFLDLDWRDECLEFYKSKNKVQTASMHQVRQPVYTSSRDTYQHYTPFLGPLLDS